MKRGQRFVATKFGHVVEVVRVAKDGTWADIEVWPAGGSYWKKRQPLKDGAFPYDVTELTS